MKKTNIDLVDGRKKEEEDEPKRRGESVEDSAMKQKNLTREDAINRQIWRKATENH